MDLRAASPARHSVRLGSLLIVFLAAASAYLQVREGAQLRSGLREVTRATVDKAIGAAQLSRDIRQLEVAVEQLLGGARRDVPHPSDKRAALRDVDRARDAIPAALDSLRLHLASTREKSKALVLFAERSGIEDRAAAGDMKRLTVASFYLAELQEHVAPLARLPNRDLLKTDAYVEGLVEPRLKYLTQLIDNFSRATNAALHEKIATKSEAAILGVQRVAITVAFAISAIALLLGALISRIRRRAESLIATSEHKFRRIVETTGEWIWSADASGHLTYSNPTVVDILGYPPHELIGRSSFDFVHDDDRAAAVSRMTSEDPRGDASVHVLRWRHKDGSLRYLENHASRLTSESGSFAGWTGVNRDVTQEHVSQKALQVSEERTRQIIETASDAFIGMDGSGMITDWNQAAEETFGWQREEVLGRRLSDVIIPPSMKGAHDRKIRGFNISQPSKVVGNSLEVSALHRDGREFPTELTVWAQESEGVVRFNAVLRDITVRKRTQEALRSSEERFRALVQNATDVTVVMDERAFLSYVSPSIEHVAGFTPAELINTSAFEQVHPDDLAIAAETLGRIVMKPGSSASIEIRSRHKDGSWRWIEATGTNLLENAAISGIVVNYRDVTERKTLEEELTRQAFHDSLTGLPNRVLFRERVSHGIAALERNSKLIAVAFLDLDDFKGVNDSLGHDAGDELLQRVADRLRAPLRSVDTAARLGGDEFALLFEDLSEPEEAVTAVQRVLAGLRDPFEIQGKSVLISGSIGIAMTGGTSYSVEDILRDADIAMYRAKNRGRGRYELYEPGMRAALLERIGLKKDLQRAVEDGELLLKYQPIVDLHGGRAVGCEALVRWNHPVRGLLHPNSFIPLAEDSGMIVPIGQWVLNEACRQALGWQVRGTDGRQMSLSVNLSPKQFEQSHFVATVAAALHNTGFPAGSLILEITESFLMEETDKTMTKLRELKDLGVRLAIDDFGTGYSSLAYLQRFPLDYLKIDKRFVDGILTGTDDSALCRAVISLAESLNLTSIAEGIETSAQAAELMALGCTLAQGYFFSKPLPALDVELLFFSAEHPARHKEARAAVPVSRPLAGRAE